MIFALCYNLCKLYVFPLQKIKKEPIREYKVDSESENADVDETEFNNHNSPPETYVDFAADPLSSVLNGDSGIGEIITTRYNSLS